MQDQSAKIVNRLKSLTRECLAGAKAAAQLMANHTERLKIANAKLPKFSDGRTGMKTKLRDDERVVKNSWAGLHGALLNVNGYIFLTDQRLVFEPPHAAAQNEATQIELSNIQSVKKCWSRFFKVLFGFPNALAITTHQGQEYRFFFIPFQRETWATAIDTQKKR